MLRKGLDWLYAASGAASAVFLILICGIVSIQIGLRALDNLIYLISGTRYGLMVPSAAEISGFFLAAASFLALAYTLRHGGHIRVNLIIRNLKGPARRMTEIFSLAVAFLLTAFFAWNVLWMVIDSWQFHEVSYGIVPVPLWIPQSSMLIGLVVLAIALLDDLIVVMRGGDPSYRRHEEAEAAQASEEALAEEIEREV